MLQGSFLLIPHRFHPPVKLSSEIIIELLVTTNQIVVFYNSSLILGGIRIFALTVGGLTENKPGTAQVGAISKAQKQQKEFKVSKYSLLRYRKNPKVEPNWSTRGDILKFFIHSVANQKN